MRIAFGYPRWTAAAYKLFGWFAHRNSAWPPLNLSLLAAVCEQAGHEAIILDGEIDGLEKETLARRLVDSKADVIGLSGYSPFFHLSVDVATSIKRINPDIPILIGGPHTTINKEKAMLPCFDYGFMGEAEDSLPEFLEYRSSMDKNHAPLHIKGLLWRDGNGVVRNNGERWIKTESMTKKELSGEHPLDRLPLPARHLLPMEKYRLGTPNGRDHFTSLQTARGCPWR